MRFALFTLIILIISCSDNATIFVQTDKYRERNEISKLIIEASDGDISITGWNHPYIEINSKATVKKGLKSDLNFLMLKPHPDEENDALIINTIIPERIQGRIDLNIFLPLYLQNITLSADESNISIKNFENNIFIENTYGIIDIDFRGNLLYAKTERGILTTQIDGYKSKEIFIINNYGRSEISIRDVFRDINLDFKSLSGRCNIYTYKNLSYKLIASGNTENFTFPKYVNKKIFKTENELYINNENTFKKVNFFIENDTGSLTFENF